MGAAAHAPAEVLARDSRGMYVVRPPECTCSVHFFFLCYVGRKTAWLVDWCVRSKRTRKVTCPAFFGCKLEVGEKKSMFVGGRLVGDLTRRPFFARAVPT